MLANDATPHGFRIVGSCHESRRFINWAAAFTAYCRCDTRAHINKEAYLSGFTYGDDFRSRDDGWSVDVRGYDGACWSPYLWFDVDRDELTNATDAARRLVMCAVTRYSLTDDEFLIFFSGRKGFHVGLPIGIFGDVAAPSVGFHGVARRIAEAIAGGIAIDLAIYGKVQPLRAPNSRHGKTGLHKRRISIDELTTLKPDAIASLAQAPLPFDDLPTASANEVAVDDWRNAMESAAQMTNARRERQAGPAKLNAMTLRFIRDGANTGDRHRLLYSAAANLREFGCSFELAYALLNESALDSGLAPRDVTRQIRCGIEGTS